MKVVAAIVLVIALAFFVGACNVEFSVVQGPASVAKQVDDALDAAKRSQDPAMRRVLGKRTRAEKAWAARLDRECLRRDRRIAAVAAPEGGLESLQRYAAKVLDVQRRHIAALQSYEAPKGYEQQGAFVLAAERQRAEALQRVLDAAARGDNKGAELGVRMFEAIGRSSKGVFRSVGADACA